MLKYKDAIIIINILLLHITGDIHDKPIFAWLSHLWLCCEDGSILNYDFLRQSIVLFPALIRRTETGEVALVGLQFLHLKTQLHPHLTMNNKSQSQKLFTSSSSSCSSAPTNWFQVC